MTEHKRIYNRKGFIWLIVAISVIGFLGFEVIWRLRVEGGPEAQLTTQWLRENDVLKTFVGDIASLEFKRLRSRFAFGFVSGNSGRFHYLVKGTKADLDVLVTWHKEASVDNLSFDKLESYIDMQTEIIWVVQKKGMIRGHR